MMIADFKQLHFFKYIAKWKTLSWEQFIQIKFHKLTHGHKVQRPTD